MKNHWLNQRTVRIEAAELQKGRKKIVCPLTGIVHWVDAPVESKRDLRALIKKEPPPPKPVDPEQFNQVIWDYIEDPTPSGRAEEAFVPMICRLARLVVAECVEKTVPKRFTLDEKRALNVCSGLVIDKLPRYKAIFSGKLDRKEWSPYEFFRTLMLSRVKAMREYC